MLRFTRNSALLFAAVSGALYLTGCSSEEGLTPDEKVPEASIDTDSYSVFGANQSRIHNYGSSSTRAGGYVEASKSFDMPDVCPSVPEGIATTSGIGDDGWKIEAGKDYLIPAGETFQAACEATATYYVAGTWNLKNGLWGVTAGAKIIVMPGGTLNMNSTIQPGLTIYNYGNLISDTGICVSEGVKVYSAVDILGVSSFGVNGPGNGNPAGEFYSRGTIQSDGDIRLNGNAVACAFIANKIDIHSVGTLKASYFEANELTLNAANVVLDNNGLVKAGSLTTSNRETRFTVNGTNAVVAAEKYNASYTDFPKFIFAPEIALDFKECFVGGNPTPKSDFEFQVSSEDQVIYVPAAGCHGSYGEKPAVPATLDEPIIEIKKVTDIDPIEEPDHGDHDHGVLSATCINFDGNTAYASYHKRGKEQKGCIEVFNDNGNGGLTLGSYMIAPNYDFNHLIVDNGNIIAVGNHPDKGAFIGSLPVSFASSENATREDFKVKGLTTNEVVYEASKKDPNQQVRAGYADAGDGNCVVRQGNYYYVATYKGYGPVNLDFSKVKDGENVVFTPTNGSCKHISINGGTAAVLALDTYDKLSSTASLWTFNADDHTFSEALSTYGQIGTVAPVDGKNVVAVDGNDIYACLSTGGLVRLSDGKTFQRGTNVPVNGMAFDDKYVYVANGSFVSVLDKADLHEVCYYHASNEKSANYIALKNGKIYVAFGENGIQVYQLVEKEITE